MYCFKIYVQEVMTKTSRLHINTNNRSTRDAANACVCIGDGVR